MGEQGPSLPGLGSHGGRMRNTFANVLSKNQVNYQNPGGAQALPALDPASTANYYSQLQGLFAGYQNQLIALKQQRVGAKADFRDAAASIRAQKIGDLATTENAAIERGVVGSSADLQNRIGVRAAAAAGIQTAKRERMETVAGTRIAAQQAGIDYFMGVQGLEAQKLAQQQALLAQQLERNLIISGQESQMDALKGIYESISAGLASSGSGGGAGAGGAGGGGGATGGNKWTRALARANRTGDYSFSGLADELAKLSGRFDADNGLKAWERVLLARDPNGSAPGR